LEQESFWNEGLMIYSQTRNVREFLYDQFLDRNMGKGRIIFLGFETSWWWGMGKGF
jgi:hypothetical protein